MMLFDISTLYLALGLPFAPQERETSAMQIADVFYLCPAAGAGRDPVEKDCQACAKARTLCAILCEMPCGGLPRDALRPISVGQNAASEKEKKCLPRGGLLFRSLFTPKWWNW